MTRQIDPQRGAHADNLLRRLTEGVTLVLPALWFQEMANALLVLDRRRKLKAEERRQALATLCGLNVTVDLEGAALAFGKVSELAERCGLSVYDATYLELALRDGLPLGTTDAALRKAARQSGIPLLIV
jgi:predicted nucleic acid-binding protein